VKIAPVWQPSIVRPGPHITWVVEDRRQSGTIPCGSAPHRRAADAGGSFGAPSSGTRRSRLRVRRLASAPLGQRTRARRSSRPWTRSEASKRTVRREMRPKRSGGRPAPTGGKKIRPTPFFSCNRVKILYKQLQKFPEPRAAPQTATGRKGGVNCTLWADTCWSNFTVVTQTR
jgi:hypothetical protein